MATQYYIKIEGIEGDVTDKGFEGWFELDAFNYGQTNSGTVHSGGGGSGVPNFQDVSLYMSGANSALTSLFGSMAGGIGIPFITIVGVEQTGASSAKVFEMTLADTHVLSVSDQGSGGGGDGFSFSVDYAKIGVTQFYLQNDGTTGAGEYFGWDLLAQKEIGQISGPTGGSTAAYTSPDAVKYFVRIDGVEGSTDTPLPGSGWTELSSFSLGGSNPHSIVNDASGKASFQDLSMTIEGNSLLADLMALNASGYLTDAIEIAGFAYSGDGKGAKVYDLVLNDLIVSSVVQGSGGAMNVSVDYAEIGLQTRSLTNDGTLGPTTSFGWNVATNQEIDFSTLDRAQATSEAGTAAPLRYFIKIDGIDGTSLVAGREGWFELDAMSFGQTQSGLAVPLGGGGAGKVSFGDLGITMTDGTALAQLLAEAAVDGEIASLVIEGVGASADGKAQPLYELTLNDVSVTSLSTGWSDGGPQSNFNATFAFEKIGLKTTAISDTGTPLSAEEFGWDLAAGMAIDPDTLAAPVAGVSGGGSAAGAVDYYLKIDGIDGDVVTAGYEGWIDVASFSFGASQSVGGKPSFQDLSVLLLNGGTLADMMTASATGDQISSLALVGVAQGDKGTQVVYELTLNDVFVSAVSDGLSDGFPATQASFSFGKIGLETTGINIDGTTGSSVEFGWDLEANSEIDPATLVQPQSGFDGFSDGSAISYFVRIDGVVGDATTAGFEGWFDVGSVAYGLFNPTSIHSGGGAGSSVPIFYDVSMSLAHNAGLTELLAAGASGETIAAVEVVGVTEGKDGGSEVYHLTLNDVIASSVQNSDSDGAAGGFYTVSFDYEKIGLVLTNRSGTGSVTSTEEFGWDRETNMDISPSSLESAFSPTGLSAPDATHYFIKIGNLKGDSTAEGHEGWFDLASFSFGESFVRDGKVSFQDLSIALQDDGALIDLLAANATGDQIAAVAIEGTRNTGKDSTTVFELVINDVLVSSVSTGSSDGPSVFASFDFGAIGLTTHTQKADGSPGPEYEFGWDVLQNVAVDPDDLVQPGDDAPLIAVTGQLLADDTGSSGSDLVTSDGHVTLNGTVSDDRGISGVRVLDKGVDIGAAVVSGNTWSFSAELGEGEHVLSAVATDTAGQSATSANQPAIVVDSTDPVLDLGAFALVADTGASAGDFVSRDGRVTVSGSVTDAGPGLTVHVFDGATDLGAATISGSGYSFAGLLGEGSHRLSVVATDLAGNETTIDTGMDVVIDQTPPDVTLDYQALLVDTGDSPSDLVSSDGRIELGGTAGDDLDLASVAIYNGHVKIGDADVAGGGWTFDATLPVGTYALSAVAFDLAGNAVSSGPAATVQIVEADPIVAGPYDRKVEGTGGSDVIVLYASTQKAVGYGGNDVFVLTPDIFDTAKFKGKVKIEGGGGYDTLDLTAFSDAFTWSADRSTLYGNGLEIKLDSVENVVGLGGMASSSEFPMLQAGGVDGVGFVSSLAIGEIDSGGRWGAGERAGSIGTMSSLHTVHDYYLL